ncbi:SAM-dependent methyltransferase [Streptomyces boncukensis]|uniref:SAM-dependent methyltransferase n=1 Tax=Streptomyces boncukensis TaxID=2711219 RepID=A0A6G4WZ53_9ACTN|nr:SAM-dependent methyltransferase [Streptomyces boncukensis]NGO70142.1 SAM-dependent methyltransferase [Streptomyces boncukensis]
MAQGPGKAETTARIDTTVPHSARIWDYWSGGKDFYDVDRQAGDRVQQVYPDVFTFARVGRHFIGRTVRYLVEEAGIRQFLDIGTGLPTVDNTHEVAQRAAPESRIVYVDNDPLVLAHAHALLTSSPQGATDYIEADVADPAGILEAAARTLDFDRPVAVMLMGILAHVPEHDEARSIVRQLMDAVTPGSHLAVRDGTNTDARYVRALEGYNRSGAVPYRPREPEQVAAFLDGLELVEPGFVPCPQWRPEAADVGPLPQVPLYGGVGRKP